MKYLKIAEKLQGKAEEEDINWYVIWPELEEAIVYEPRAHINRKQD